jgi:hypothetical protein
VLDVAEGATQVEGAVDPALEDDAFRILNALYLIRPLGNRVFLVNLTPSAVLLHESGH